VSEGTALAAGAAHARWPACARVLLAATAAIGILEATLAARRGRGEIQDDRLRRQGANNMSAPTTLSAVHSTKYGPMGEGSSQNGSRTSAVDGTACAGKRTRRSGSDFAQRTPENAKPA
jgi:hypothetical protein